MLVVFIVLCSSSSSSSSGVPVSGRGGHGGDFFAVRRRTGCPLFISLMQLCRVLLCHTRTTTHTHTLPQQHTLPPSLIQCARSVLSTPDPHSKVTITRTAAEAWRKRNTTTTMSTHMMLYTEKDRTMPPLPLHPARPDRPIILTPAELGQQKKGESISASINTIQRVQFPQ